MELSVEVFKDLTCYVYNLCGLEIKEEKLYLIRQRLAPVAKSFGCVDLRELHTKLKQDNNPKLRDEVLSAITTNETSFFRDVHPFESFNDHVMPELTELVLQRKAKSHPRKGSKVRIWCAASSYGQEPYSIAMQIHEYLNANKGKRVLPEDFSILATDISPYALSKAIAGEYSELEVSRGLSEERRKKYFLKENDLWVTHDKIQTMVEFRIINLTGAFTMLGGFDVIFCRNILIYFDKDTKVRILKQFHQMLAGNGLLALGATENLYGLEVDFKSERNGKSVFYTRS